MIRDRFGKNGFGIICGLLINLLCPGLLSLQSFLLHLIVQEGALSTTLNDDKSMASRCWFKIKALIFSEEFQPVIVTNTFGNEDNHHEHKNDHKAE